MKDLIELLRVIDERIEEQQKLADDLARDYEESTGDLDLLQARERELGILIGLEKFFGLLRKAVQSSDEEAVG